MRLLQLPTGPNELLDLHPNMTVVQGLDDGSHRRLIEAVTGLARGESPVQGGLLEAHGVLFELRADLLTMLETSPPDLDPVVRAADLPTQPLTVDGRELRAREREFDQLLARIAEQAERLSQARGAVAAAAAAVDEAHRARAEAESRAASRVDDLDAATRRLEQVTKVRRRIDEQLAELQSEKDAAEAVRREVEDRTAPVLEAARVALARQAELGAAIDLAMADRDPGAAAAVSRAQAELEGLIAVVQAERDAAAAGRTRLEESPAEVVPVAERLERVVSRLAELDRVLVAVATVDPAEVAEALALLKGGDSAEQIASPEALALADELDGIRAELGEGVTEPLAEHPLSAARERLDDARQELLEATNAVRNPGLDRDEVERLEDAHDALLDAIDKSDGRFAGNRTRQRVVARRAAEQAVLDRLGFASYSDYMMGSFIVHIDPEKTAALDVARSALAAAEEEWEQVERATDEALARAAVLDHRRGLIERARGLLGAPVPVADLPGALRDLRVPAISAEVSAGRLRAALERTGLELADEDLDREELRLIADAWLSEASSADVRRLTTEEERVLLQGEEHALRDEAEVAAARGMDESIELKAEEGREVRLAAARQRLLEAEDRWLAHEIADDRIAAIRSDLDVATEAARAAAPPAVGAEEDVAAAVAALAAVVERERALQDEGERAVAAEAEAAACLEALTADASLDPEALEAAIGSAKIAQRNADHSLDAETHSLSVLDADAQAAAIAVERLQDIVASQETGSATEADELEWYLLARLAAQRAVSVAGSLPLLLDDALRGLDAPGVDHLLGRLERMAEAVQVIVISDDPVVAAWANEAGPTRAAVVRPAAP